MFSSSSKKSEITFWVVGLLLLGTGTFFLFYGGIDSLVSRSVKEMWNVGHIIYFALTIYLLIKLNFLKKVSLPYQWLIFIVLSLVWGTLIEVLQYGTQRTPDLTDIAGDLTGCLIVLSFYPGLLKLPSSTKQLTLRLFVVLILIVQLLPLVVAIIDEAIARSQFPVLSNFETRFELDRWSGSASKEVVKTGLKSELSQLKIGLKTTQYSGVNLQYFPSDWRKYKTLHVKIFNPESKAIFVVIRIHDKKHQSGRFAYVYGDRFNRRLNLIQGWNNIEIPLLSVESAPSRRKMDLSQVVDVSLFSISLAEPRVIYLDKIYLTD